MNATYLGMFLKANLGTVKRDNQNNAYGMLPLLALLGNIMLAIVTIKLMLCYCILPSLAYTS